MEKIFLTNAHFTFLDAWYESCTQSEIDDINLKYKSQLDYLGLQLEEETYGENGFEFTVVNEENWKLAKQKHVFLNSN